MRMLKGTLFKSWPPDAASPPDVRQVYDLPGHLQFSGASLRHIQRDLESLLETDDHGFILTGPDLQQGRGEEHWPRGWKLDRDPYWLESSQPGIFAAGDVRHGSVKRVAAGVGEGATAVQFIHQYLASGER